MLIGVPSCAPDLYRVRRDERRPRALALDEGEPVLRYDRFLLDFRFDPDTFRERPRVDGMLWFMYGCAKKKRLCGLCLLTLVAADCDIRIVGEIRRQFVLADWAVQICLLRAFRPPDGLALRLVGVARAAQRP